MSNRLVGKRAIAKIVSDWEPDYAGLPKEFEEIGQGASRVAVVHNDFPDVVYKRAVQEYIPGTNIRERNAIRRAQRRPVENWKVPKATLYTFENNNVIAMERVHGSIFRCECFACRNFEYCQTIRSMRKTAKKIEKLWGISDLHKGNYLFDGNTGEFVCIDFGETPDSTRRFEEMFP